MAPDDPDDADDTRSALAVLRELPAERAADEAAELEATQTSPTAQVARAIAILDERRPRTLEDRRGIGLPPSLEDSRWRQAVLGRIAELDALTVLDAWLDIVEADGGTGAQEAAVAALSRIESVEPLAERVRRIFQHAPVKQRWRVRDAIIESQIPIDPALLALVRGLLVSPESYCETAEVAVVIAGALARREPAVAAMIAERARWDRMQWRHEVYLPRSAPRRAAGAAAMARAVEYSGCSALAATALLQLEERGARQRWAQALLAVAGDAGKAHLLRMRGRPGWSELVATDEPAPEGLDALVSPIADVRRRTLETLSREPRPERLRALLLAAELDRHVIQNVLRLQWTRLSAKRWFPLLVTHGPAPERDRRLAGDPDVRGYRSPVTLAAAQILLVQGRTEYLLTEMLDAGAARAPMAVEQDMTPLLRELEAEGVEAFAARHIPDPRLTVDELAMLDAAEAELAASAARWWSVNEERR